VAVRAAPLFATTLNAITPLPLPDAPCVTVSHAALLTVVHEHPLPVDSETVPLPSPGPTLRLDGEIEYVHAGMNARCVTVKVRVAIVAVPVRSAPVFAARVRRTCPFPVPVAPEATVIHDALLVAVQVQPAPAITLTVPWVASGPMFASVFEMEYVHAAAPAA
jgi:hypothetical protein